MRIYKVNIRSAELKNTADWAITNNLSLNLRKSKEIVFVDKRRKHKRDTPKTIDGIRREQNIQVLNITMASVARHVQHLVTSYAQVFYALKNSAGSWRMLEVNAGGRPFCNLVAVFVRTTCIPDLLEPKTGNRFVNFLRRSARVSFCPYDSASTTYVSKQTEACT